MAINTQNRDGNAPRSRWFAVYADEVCIGHLISRDRGKTFEAYADSRLIGSFDSRRAGADALAKAVQR